MESRPDDGFEMPEFTAPGDARSFCEFRLQFLHYLGWLNAEPVATSSLFLGAGVAGIYNVTTLPEVGHQGIGGEMTYTPLWERSAREYRIGIQQSTHLGFNVYRRPGFRSSVPSVNTCGPVGSVVYGMLCRGSCLRDINVIRM